MTLGEVLRRSTEVLERKGGDSPRPAQALPDGRVTALEVSAAALDLARENMERGGLDVHLLEHDLREGLPGGPYDLVAANPPYVEPDELSELSPEVRDFEPRLALVRNG